MSLGVLGSRNALTKQIMQNEILNPILDDMEKPIKKVILPEDTLSSTYIECWANRKDIQVDYKKSDWTNYGKRAGVFRDLQIEKQSSVILVFEGPRSRYYLDLAEKIAKRRPDCPIYVVEASSVTPVLLEVDFTNKHSISDKDEKEILTIPKMFAKNSQKCLINDDV
jgi:homoserine trans-succinylase